MVTWILVAFLWLPVPFTMWSHIVVLFTQQNSLTFSTHFKAKSGSKLLITCSFRVPLELCSQTRAFSFFYCKTVYSAWNGEVKPDLSEGHLKVGNCTLCCDCITAQLLQSCFLPSIVLVLSIFLFFVMCVCAFVVCLCIVMYVYINMHVHMCATTHSGGYFMCISVLSAYMYVHLCLTLHMKDGKWNHIPWNWSYGRLLAAV